MRRAYTLVELMVVVIIIGILSLVAIPSYLCYRDRARNAEALATLDAIRTHQTDHWNSEQSYADSFTGIGVGFPGYDQTGMGPSELKGQYFYYKLTALQGPSGKFEEWFVETKCLENGAIIEGSPGCRNCAWFISQSVSNPNPVVELRE